MILQFAAEDKKKKKSCSKTKSIHIQQIEGVCVCVGGQTCDKQQIVWQLTRQVLTSCFFYVKWILPQQKGTAN